MNAIANLQCPHPFFCYNQPYYPLPRQPRMEQKSLPDIFISYSRKDIAFARLIKNSLEKSGLNIWIDWDRIPSGVPWWKTIEKAIQDSHTFLFIISKTSITSSVCKDEINTALRNNKRIIPVIVDNLSPEAVGEFVPDLRKINWSIFQRDRIFRIEVNPAGESDKPEDHEVALPGLPQFEQALEKLSREIQTDWEWVTYHTRLQSSALLWEDKPDPSFLLRGAQLEEAERRQMEAAGKDPQPNLLQTRYITASRQEETRRQASERALEQKAARRQRLFLWTVGIGLIIALVLSVLFLNQRDVARSETNMRATAEAVAVDQAKTALSRQLAAQSENSLTRSNWELAGLLAIEAGQSKNTLQAFEALRKVEAYPWFTSWVHQSRLLGIDRIDSKLLDLRWRPTEDITQARASASNQTISYWSPATGQQVSAPTTLWSDYPNLRFKLIAIPSDARQMQVVEVSTGKPVFQVEGVYGYFNPDESLLYTISCSSDKCETWNRDKLIIWDTATGNKLKTIIPNTYFMHRVTWADNSPRLLVLGCDGLGENNNPTFCAKMSLKIWDALSGNLLQTFKTDLKNSTWSFTWMQDDTQILSSGCDNISNPGRSAICTSNSLRLWDVASGESRWAIIGPDSYVWSQDKQRILSFYHDPTPTLREEGDVIKIWDAVSGAHLFTLAGHSDLIQSAVWGKDGSTILSTSKDGESRFWQFKPTGEFSETGSPPIPLSETLVWKEPYPAWSPDHTRLVMRSDSKTITIWDLQNGQVSLSLTPYLQKAEFVKWNSDGTRLITFGCKELSGTTCKTYEVNLWDARDGSQLMAFGGFTDRFARDFILSPDEQKLLTIENSKNLIIWSVTTGKALFMYSDKNPILDISWSPDSKKLFAYTQDDKIHVWSVDTWKELFTLSQIETFAELPWSPDFTRAISITTVKDKNTNQSIATVELYDLDSGKRVAEINVEKATGNLDWIPNSHFFQVSINYGDHYERPIYDASNGKLIKELDSLSTSLQPDRNRFFVIPCSKYENKKCTQSTTMLVDIFSPTHPVTLSQTLINTPFVSWSKKGDRFLSVGESGDISIWDAATGKILTTLRIPQRSGTMLSMYETGNSTTVVKTSLQKAAWSVDDTSIATLDCYVSPNPGQSCNDGAVRIWNSVTGVEIFSVAGKEFAWNSTGERILVSDNNTIKQWYVNINDVTRSLCGIMPRKLSEKEWALYLGDAPYRDTCADLLKP